MSVQEKKARLESLLSRVKRNRHRFDEKLIEDTHEGESPLRASAPTVSDSIPSRSSKAAASREPIPMATPVSTAEQEAATVVPEPMRMISEMAKPAQPEISAIPEPVEPKRELGAVEPGAADASPTVSVETPTPSAEVETAEDARSMAPEPLSDVPGTAPRSIAPAGELEPSEARGEPAVSEAPRDIIEEPGAVEEAVEVEEPAAVEAPVPMVEPVSSIEPVEAEADTTEALGVSPEALEERPIEGGAGASEEPVSSDGEAVAAPLAAVASAQPVITRIEPVIQAEEAVIEVRKRARSAWTMKDVFERAWTLGSRKSQP